MVSAVFHGPWGPPPAAKAPSASGAKLALVTPSDPTVSAVNTVQDVVAKPVAARRNRLDWRGLLAAVLPVVGGLALLVGIWSLVSITSGSSIPSPYETLNQAVVVFSDPFYRKGPNDQGIGWNILMSLERVALGFGMAALVGIPAGFMIGRFKVLSRMFNPLISLLRPVSPLAWLTSACWSSRAPTRRRSGPSSSARSGPWSSTRR